MNITGKMKLKGRLKISLNGKVVKDVDNLIVNVGKQWVASRMQGVSDTVMSHMSIGTGTTAANASNTRLVASVYHQALAVSGGSATDNVLTFAATIAAGNGTGAITEAGIFNSASINAGDMLSRTVFSVVNKNAQDSMTITWAVTIF